MKSLVNNNLQTVGSIQQIKKVLQFIKGHSFSNSKYDLLIDFNNIVEMPESLNCEFSTLAQIMQLLLSNIKNGRMTLAEARVFYKKYEHLIDKRNLNLASMYKDNFEKFGSTCSDFWRLQNWGTCKNAFNQRLISANKNFFETEHTNAKEAIEHLSKKFPDVTFNYDWEEIVWGLGGNAIFKDGLKEIHETEEYLE